MNDEWEALDYLLVGDPPEGWNVATFEGGTWRCPWCLVPCRHHEEPHTPTNREGCTSWYDCCHCASRTYEDDYMRGLSEQPDDR